MSKLFALSQEREQQVRDVIEKTTLGTYGLTFKIMGSPKVKGLVKVSKANPVTEYLEGEQDIITIIIHEEVFDKMEADGSSKEITEIQNMIIENALSTIEVDTEKDKVSVKQNVIATNTGMLAKYGYEKAVRALELGELTSAMIEKEEADRKASEKEAKAQKKNKNNF